MTHRLVFALLLMVSSAIGCRRPTPAADPRPELDTVAAQRPPLTPDPNWIPPWADTTGESGMYPVGQAVDVYRAVLDLYFVDDDESPSIIVLHDTAERRGGGPCPIACAEPWPHKSKIDTATILAFSRLSPKRPRIIPFGYRIPIAFMSGEEFRRIWEALREKPENSGSNSPEFARRYPGAWGWLQLTKVGFNRAYDEALVQARFACGELCTSDEVLFLRKINNVWTVIERIPNSAQALVPALGMRYRGPEGSKPSESEILTPAIPAQANAVRTEKVDAAMVYRAVLDSLYSFQGESPRQIVITDYFLIDTSALPAHARAIDSATLERYTYLQAVRAPLTTKLDYRKPVLILPRDSMPALERRGIPLAAEVAERREHIEPTPFWLAFRERYPGAWGMVGLTRVAFNQNRTQALVFTHHSCGALCFNADTWLLEMSGDRWRIVERIPRGKDSHWLLEPLRYVGLDADPNAYRPRRARGVITNASTGIPLADLRLTLRRNSGSVPVTTDAAGRYTVDNLPLAGGLPLTVQCPGQPSREILAAMILSRPGLDSTMNVGVDFRRCLRQTRARALVSGRPSPDALRSTYPSADVAAVYRGVLDALYPAGGSSRGPILLHPYTHRYFEQGVDAEFPRLIKQSVVDSTIEKSLANLPEDSAWLRPKFDYRRPVIILGPDEQRFLLQQVEDVGGYDNDRPKGLTELAKEAYPGADAILSFSRVALNDARTQALVEVSRDDSPEYKHGEMMLLHKFAGGWRVVRRHLEREVTSGERIGDRCEPGDAPKRAPTLREIERIVGDADITVVPTALQIRQLSATRGIKPVRQGSSHYRFVPTDTLRRFYWLPQPGDKRPAFRRPDQQTLAVVQVFDSTDKPRKGIAASLDFAGGEAAFTIRADRLVLDGWMEQFTILRVTGREFFGSWFTVAGHTVPWKGYFCGRLR